MDLSISSGSFSLRMRRTRSPASFPAFAANSPTEARMPRRRDAGILALASFTRVSSGVGSSVDMVVRSFGRSVVRSDAGSAEGVSAYASCSGVVSDPPCAGQRLFHVAAWSVQKTASQPGSEHRAAMAYLLGRSFPQTQQAGMALFCGSKVRTFEGSRISRGTAGDGRPAEVATGRGWRRGGRAAAGREGQPRRR